MSFLRSSILVLLTVGVLTGCRKDSDVTVNGKTLSQQDVQDSLGELKDVATSTPENLKGMEAKTEMGKVMKEMMMEASKIEKKHEERLSTIALGDLLSEASFKSKASIEKGIRELDELAKIETDFVESKLALGDKFQSKVDSAAFRHGVETSRVKLRTLLTKELAFTEAGKKYLNLALKVRPEFIKGTLYWPDRYLDQANALDKDAIEKLRAMVNYANEMEGNLQESKDKFLNAMP